jgi:hypothetical protein
MGSSFLLNRAKDFYIDPALFSHEMQRAFKIVADEFWHTKADPITNMQTGHTQT